MDCSRKTSHAIKKWWIKWKYVLDKNGELFKAEFLPLIRDNNQARVLPCFSTSFKGSTPGERMKNMGVAGLDSSKETAKSNDLPITYLLPTFSSTKSLRGRIWLSSPQHFLLSLTNKNLKSGILIFIPSLLHLQILWPSKHCPLFSAVHETP